MKKLRDFRYLFLSKNTDLQLYASIADILSEFASLVLLLTIGSKIEDNAKRTDTRTDGEHFPDY